LPRRRRTSRARSVVSLTSHEAAVLALGADAVRTYEQVKRFYTRYGSALERSFAAAVGGRVGGPGEADVITRLGEWEFCAAANTKNAAGEAAQRAKVGVGKLVQATGIPRPGRISGVTFLSWHGVLNPEHVSHEAAMTAMHEAAQRQ